MQCPHHSNRLCPAHRSHPRPRHQPCPPPSPYESHPRHRAAPPAFPQSAASRGAESFQHAGRMARTASQRAPRENYLIPAPSSVAAFGAVRQRARHSSHRGAQTDSAECRAPNARTNGSRCSRSVSSQGARRRALALPSLGRNRLRASLGRCRGLKVASHLHTPRRIAPCLSFPRRCRVCFTRFDQTEI